MNKDQFFQIVSNPSLIKEGNLNGLKEILEEYPYFQTAHTLYLKGLHLNNNLKFESQLKRSATNIPDRKKLFKLLFQKETVLIKLEQKEESFADNIIEVTSEVLSKKTSEEKPIELLDFSFIGKDELQEEPRLNLPQFEYSFSDETMNSSQTIDYFSSYKLEDDPDGVTDFDSMYSFEEWVKIIGEKNKQPGTSVENNKAVSEKFQLIDNFIRENPRIRPSDMSTDQSFDISSKSVVDDSDFITETLAKVYIKQGYYEKAISAFEKLCLKYPEKNSYFAGQIENIKELIKKQ